MVVVVVAVGGGCGAGEAASTEPAGSTGRSGSEALFMVEDEVVVGEDWDLVV